MSLDRLYYELRLLGKKVFLPPILVIVGYILFAVLLHYLKTPPSRFLESGPEMILPIIIGIFAGAAATDDPAQELQLTVPRKYHQTGILRIAMIVIWAACLAVLFFNGIAVFRLEYMFQPPQSTAGLSWLLIKQLVWIAPLFWCIGISLCFGLLTRSRAAATAFLGSLWVAEIIFKDFFAITPWLRPLLLFPTTLVIPPTPISQEWYNIWLTTRLEVLGTGLALLFLGWVLLHQTEALLRGMTVD